MDLVEIKTDPDKNGIFKINNKDLQVFKLVATDTNGKKHEQIYSLAGLTVEGAGV